MPLGHKLFRMNRLTMALLIALIFVCAEPRAGSQLVEQGQEVPIQVQVTAVPVDVIVTDREGNPILDLTKADFELYENEVRQTIEFFSVNGLSVPRKPWPNDPIQVDRSLGDPDDTPASARTFLIFLGRGKQTDFHSLDKLVRFVESGLGDGDQAALLAYNRVTPFTIDHGAIARILTAFAPANEEIEAILGLESKHFPAAAQSSFRSSIQSKIDAVFAAGRLSPKEVLPARSGPELLSQRRRLEQMQGGQALPAENVREGLSAEPSGNRPGTNPGPSSQSPFSLTEGRLPRDYPAEFFPSTSPGC